MFFSKEDLQVLPKAKSANRLFVISMCICDMSVSLGWFRQRQTRLSTPRAPFALSLVNPSMDITATNCCSETVDGYHSKN